jgi:RNA polymerase sigma-70 factor (ECF subfamily)
MANARTVESERPEQVREAARDEVSSDDLAAVYDAYAGGVYRYALALLGSAEEAEDVVQEVFLGLMRRRNRGGIRHLREYVLRATRNQAYIVLRKRKMRKTECETWIELGEDLADRERAVDISAALGRVPVEQREIVELRLSEDLSFREIAKVLGIPQNTAASRYRLAVMKLRAMLAGGDEDG